MLPYDQDVYDSEGNLETQILYSNYAQFSAGKYPSKITIKRPQEGIQLVLTVDDVKENIDPHGQPIPGENSRRNQDPATQVTRSSAVRYCAPFARNKSATPVWLLPVASFSAVVPSWLLSFTPAP